MHKKYDMVILGAGINGVAIAKALASSGKKVLVVENHILLQEHHLIPHGSYMEG